MFPLSRFVTALSCFTFIVFLSSAHGVETSIPESVGVSSYRLNLLKRVLNEHVEEGKVAGLVAGVARHGKVVFLESMGWQDIEQSIPMEDSSIFQIRSMSKPVSAVAALQLVEQGQLSLADPVSKYIPSFADLKVFVDPQQPDLSATRSPTREPTIEDLLLNTAGLSHRFSSLYRTNNVRSRADSLHELVDKVAAIPLIGDPGDQWVYSISITVLGRVVEIVSGLEFDDYLNQEIFDPLDMVDTGFFVPKEKHRRLARAYLAADSEKPLTRLPDMAVAITADPPLLEGAAGLVSTVPDYLRFLQMLLNQGELENQRVLQAETVTAMTINQVATELMPFGTNPSRPMLDRGWGYGLAVVTDATKSEVGVNNGEFGWNGSLGTFSWADPKTGTVAVLMLQIQPAAAYDLSAKFKALVYQSLIN